ncbi:MAG TPA: nitrilase-related carbon-nitrogen hydrolase, partial [Gemmataceae bacterium]|nr:nitrilase-related carbon-nitrogen hydrolase [Gemmataceae bacterium]
STVRVGAVQARPRIIDYKLKEPAEVLTQVGKSLDAFERIIHQAGEAKCDALAFPEDTLGLLHWEGANQEAAKHLLPEAVKRMLDRLGRAAASQRMYLVVCSNTVDGAGAKRNTAFLLDRDGKEIGRYHKVSPTWPERKVKPGDSFPVFATTDLGTVGMLICYDMVMPESPRCLALAGAGVIFWPTMGGAAIGDDDIALAACRTRAVENFVYLVVAQRGGGAMIVSPQGKIIARAQGPDGLAIADIDPFAGREGGDAMNHQLDMRARLFRERNPAAYGILTDPKPPVLAKVPLDITIEEAADISARVLTIGEDEFKAAEALARAGKKDQAVAAFEQLRKSYRGSWIDRVSAERLKTLRGTQGGSKANRK